MQTRESEKDLSTLSPTEYVRYFRRAVSNIPKIYREYSQNTYVELLQTIDNESQNKKLSALDLWDAVSKHADEVYAAKILPRFISKDYLDSIFQITLRLFPRKDLERNEIQYLQEQQKSAEIKNKSVEENYAILLAENAQLKESLKNATSSKDEVRVTNEEAKNTQKLPKEKLSLNELITRKDETIKQLNELNEELRINNSDLADTVKKQAAEILNLKAKLRSESQNKAQDRNSKKPSFF